MVSERDHRQQSWRVAHAKSRRTDTIRAPRRPGLEGRTGSRARPWAGSHPCQGRRGGPTDLKIRVAKSALRVPGMQFSGSRRLASSTRWGRLSRGVEKGDEVARLLPALGGYGEYALASSWSPKPPGVTWGDAAALPVSAEAAVGTLNHLGLSGGEALLILGAAGSVGMIATSPPAGRSWQCLHRGRAVPPTRCCHRAWSSTGTAAGPTRPSS
jgi:hypothetical protein